MNLTIFLIRPLLIIPLLGGLDLLCTTMEVALRLCLLPHAPPSTLSLVVRHAFTWLCVSEELIGDIRLSQNSDAACWARCVRTMWKVRMTLDDERDARMWDGVTARLLAWNSALLAKGEECEEGEWARQECVRCLSES